MNDLMITMAGKKQERPKINSTLLISRTGATIYRKYTHS